MELKQAVQAVLDIGFRDDEGTLGYVDMAYTNACSKDAAATLRTAWTAGKSASEREEHKWKRYPFVVEARGRLGAVVVAFLRQHAPMEELLRSAALARAMREVSIITQRGLAALLLAAERPVAA